MSRMSQTYQWVSFDLDDTLYHPVPRYIQEKRTRFVSNLAQRWGMADLEEAGRRFDTLSQDPVSGFLSVFEDQGMTPRQVLDLVAGIDRRGMFSPDPTLAEGLLRLKARGVSLAMVTNNIVTTSREILTYLAVDPALFDIMVTLDEGLPPKPSTAPFRRFLEKAGTGADRCIHVGDSYAADMQPANALGMTTIQVQHPGKTTGPAAHHVTQDIHGALALVYRILSAH